MVRVPGRREIRSPALHRIFPSPERNSSDCFCCHSPPYTSSAMALAGNQSLPLAGPDPSPAYGQQNDANLPPPPPQAPAEGMCLGVNQSEKRPLVFASVGFGGPSPAPPCAGTVMRGCGTRLEALPATLRWRRSRHTPDAQHTPLAVCARKPSPAPRSLAPCGHWRPCCSGFCPSALHEMYLGLATYLPGHLYTPNTIFFTPVHHTSSGTPAQLPPQVQMLRVLPLRRRL